MSSTFYSWKESLSTEQNLSISSEKKYRHRHSPSQLAALNDLYHKSDHPPLDQRINLAERLGMETKTVNAWFQNKRASTKKRSRGGSSDIPQLSSNSSSTVNTPHHQELEDFPDTDYPPFDNLLVSLEHPSHQPLDNSQFYTEPDIMPRKIRIRPTVQQTDELKKLYSINPHPSREEREDLVERTGMRYQSITNWFQNQRSLAKKRKEDEVDATVTPASKSSKLESSRESRTFSAFPPPTTRPSLLSRNPNCPPHPQEPTHPTRTSDLATAPPAAGPYPSPPSSNRNKIPYRRGVGSSSRTRRTRPEPYQLDALKDLFTRTSNPSIEERSALAHEIGMDLGKVTNWFRNLRQTARKRARKGDGDEDRNPHSSLSRSGTPSLNSSSSSYTNEADDLMDLDDGANYHYKHVPRPHSDIASDDDEYQEEASSPEPPSFTSPSAAMPPHYIRMGHHRIVEPTCTNLDKTTAPRFSDIKLDDALLLLSFHRHIVH